MNAVDKNENRTSKTTMVLKRSDWKRLRMEGSFFNRGASGSLSGETGEAAAIIDMADSLGLLVCAIFYSSMS